MIAYCSCICKIFSAAVRIKKEVCSDPHTSFGSCPQGPGHQPSMAMYCLLSTAGFASFFGWLGIDTEFVGALPTALMKSLSGSGSRGMMVDAMSTYGVDSFVGRVACTVQGSTDTTFYILAVYFGSVGVRKTRYAVGYALLADVIGAISAITVSYFFFK